MAIAADVSGGRGGKRRLLNAHELHSRRQSLSFPSVLLVLFLVDDARARISLSNLGIGYFSRGGKGVDWWGINLSGRVARGAASEAPKGSPVHGDTAASLQSSCILISARLGIGNQGINTLPSFQTATARQREQAVSQESVRA
jgi:hypothetical protein